MAITCEPGIVWEKDKGFSPPGSFLQYSEPRDVTDNFDKGTSRAVRQTYHAKWDGANHIAKVHLEVTTQFKSAGFLKGEKAFQQPAVLTVTIEPPDLAQKFAERSRLTVKPDDKIDTDPVQVEGNKVTIKLASPTGEGNGISYIVEQLRGALEQVVPHPWDKGTEHQDQLKAKGATPLSGRSPHQLP